MLPLVFAEFTPLPPAAQWAIVSILGVIATLVIIWAAIRRQPPVGEDLVKLRSSIEALNSSVEALTKAHEKHITHGAEIENLQEQVRRLQHQREDDQRNARAYTANSNEKIFKRIEDLSDSMSKNFQNVERALGQLEGRVEALAKD
jgi:predicted  nucleic acid-binding Zn-ribbon protein